MKKQTLWLLILLMLCAVLSDAIASDQGGEDVQVPEITGLMQKPIPDNDAMAFLKKMGVGWNLGNTFDAYQNGRTDLGTESMWVGVRTTEEVIAAVHDAGFSTIRIPVSWHDHVIGADFTIQQKWLDRIQEVVDWAIKRGMYVIINTHHDEGYQYYYPTKTYYDVSERYVTSIWRQVSERFKEYDEHLIFESLNEPRLKGHPNEWWFNASSKDCLEAAECINLLNQAFVDTVRASGGKNADRYLMVPGYDASSDGALRAQFALPQDTADNKIIVSVHAYTPYNFALEDGGVKTFEPTIQQTTEIGQFMNSLYTRYIEKGIPVVIGEFGARAKQDNLQDRVNYAAYYNAFASIRNIPTVWWDNHVFFGNGEIFGLLNRRTCEWAYPEIVQALIQYGGYEKMPARQ